MDICSFFGCWLFIGPYLLANLGCSWALRGLGTFDVTYRPRCLWDIGGSVVVVRPFRAGVRSMCSFVHANVNVRLAGCASRQRKHTTSVVCTSRLAIYAPVARPLAAVSYRIVSYRIVSYRIVSYRIVSYRLPAHQRKSPRLLYTRGGAIIPDCYSFSRLALSGDVGGNAVGDDEADGTAHTVEVLIVEDVAGGENGGGAIVAAVDDVGGLRGGTDGELGGVGGGDAVDPHLGIDSVVGHHQLFGEALFNLLAHRLFPFQGGLLSFDTYRIADPRRNCIYELRIH